MEIGAFDSIHNFSSIGVLLGISSLMVEIVGGSGHYDNESAQVVNEGKKPKDTKEHEECHVFD